MPLNKLSLMSVLCFLSLPAVAAQATQRFDDLTDSAFTSNLKQTEIYRLTSCPTTFETLLQNQFQNDIIEVVSAGQTLQVVPESIAFCGVDDLDQGSFNLNRNVVFCADVTDGKKVTSASIFATTQGDMFCESETLTSVVGIWVH